MYLPGEEGQNPPKRSFSEITDAPAAAADQDASKRFNPRRYQTQVYEVARRRNTIAVMETGTGKTMIAVMLIDEIGQAIKSSGDTKLMIFLAPTVHLVHQQFEVIKEHTSFEVEEYYGAKGVDAWDKEHWEEEFKAHDILVMTPQILLDALRKAFLTIEAVCLLIMDECHRATGNHPYTKIMKEFYHRSSIKPKVFGMTASPVIRKGVSSKMDCEDQISELESILDSQIYTVEDKTEMEVYAPTAKETRRFYNPTWFSSLDLKEKIKASWTKSDARFLKLQESIQSNFKDLDDKVKTLRKRLSSDYEKILYCLDDLGLICSYEAVKVCLENAPTSEECEVYRESSLQCRYFLDEVVGIIKQSLMNDFEDFLDVGFDYLKAVDLGYVSPKLNELVQLFHSFGVCSDLLCLIFVNRIITAKVIERFMRRVTSLSHFKISYLTGSTTSVDALTPKIQKETLKLFSCGEVNLLFSTDVVEEGIHVPNCSCVIRFDLPKTVRSYVQSRGRARQDNSQFILMLERGNEQQKDQLFEIIKSEGLMTNTALNRDPEESVLKPCTLDEISEYIVDSTGASVTADSSVRLLHKYCDTLPRDKYFIPKPAFQFSYLGDFYECKITLPPNAAFHTLVGPACKNSGLSKQFACLEACKKLHESGALNDHLLPSTNKSLEKDMNVERKGSASGAGTTKRKELHGTTGIHALSGTWAEKLYGVVFYAYKFDFSCDIVTELYSGFILLIESELAEDVGNIELELYLVSKRVKASVSSCGQVGLDGEQMAKAKLFQEFFFNGLFGKLFHRISPVEKQREFLLMKDTRKLWRHSYMYLVLPLETLNDSNNESWTINWGGISSCVSVVEFLKQNVGAPHRNGDARTSVQNRIVSSGTGCNSSQILHLANSSVDEKCLKDMVVVAVHTGKIYSVFEVVGDTSAESPFDTSEYNTYAEYFHKKYGILLMYPGQPLLRLKQNHNPHNLLVNFIGGGGSGKTSESGLVNGKERMYAHMPPELLVCTDVRREVLKSFYLLPSLIHRLESLMLASQLREEINTHPSSLQISSSLILEALTSVRCSEDFSMERLELLGDSVLKYTVGCSLFLKYPDKHDGQLSSLRQSVICNANLHRLGIDRNLQGYIRDGAFDPRRWVGPGQLSIRPVPCECGVDTLEVPVDSKFQTRDREVMVGKCCDRGHRWMGSKTISDCVEALIGAYYVAGGLSASVHFMKWLHIDVELEPSLVSEAITAASLHSCNPTLDDIGVLESKLSYVFSTKGLLQEAITHASEQESKLDYSYERLEFLGDCVLDLLITWYLYQSHKDIDPGELTDLRAASVNNENFAQAAVRHNLQQHLQHCSGLLQSQIIEYAKSLSEHDGGTKLQGQKGPKALGDMVESIAGAILIDTELNLDEVWRVYKPLLSPIVTPDKLELPPLRELIELCGSLGYFYKEKSIKKGETVHAELSVQLKDSLLIGEGIDRSKKIAKGEAAHHLLKELEKRGITHPGSARKRKLDVDQVGDSFPKKRKKTVMHLPMDTKSSNSATERKISTPEKDIPVIKAINMKKGGPRVSLFELCKQLQWQMPTFKPTEKDFSFISTITLYIPNFGSIECTGDPRSDKKSSLDSAALTMLYDLERQGRIIIGGC
ncbi:endoribonuclease Dicer homolog 3a-like [Argentina anserina]|uniref:endoribonuclease Dicer homolog 3a-like n=1 Tax=Argentina anserina TaxID=57926 RepID=UPI0021769246|nr:endoribonuclease Dicer homolog 3a-like [Potentilla anserina]